MNQNTNTPKKKKRSGWKWLLFLLLLIAVLGVVFYFFVRVSQINSGQVGVKSSIDNPIDPSVEYEIQLVNGYVVYIPMLTKLEVYSTSVFSSHISDLKAYTKDGIQFMFAPNIALQLDATKADLYYRNFGNKEFSKNEVITEVIKNVLVNEVSLFDTDSLIQNKVVFEAEINKELTNKLAQYGFTVKNINTNLEYPQSVKDQVNFRLQTEQELSKAKSDAELAFIEANSKRVQDSLSYSNLTKLSIQKLFIDKWDGRLAPNPEQPIMYRDINSNEGIEVLEITPQAKTTNPTKRKESNLNISNDSLKKSVTDTIQ